MKYIITESQLKTLCESYNQVVVKIQQDLVDKGYDLGPYGLNKDGVDGVLGGMTKRAYEKEFGKPYGVVKQNNDVSSDQGLYDAMLIGGLDTRPGDYPIGQQVNLLKSSFNGKIKGFRYNANTYEILNFLKQNPNIHVFMFSAGCRKAGAVSKSPDVDLNKIYIIEPYAVKGNSDVVNAVSNGVPSNHVFVGPNSARGKGVVNGSVSSNSDSHWGSLKNAGNLI